MTDTRWALRHPLLTALIHCTLYALLAILIYRNTMSDLTIVCLIVGAYTVNVSWVLLTLKRRQRRRGLDPHK